MREAYFDKLTILEESDFIGFCLGHDHCYEHECGVGGLNSLFNISEEIPSPGNFGIDRFKVSAEKFKNYTGDVFPVKYLSYDIKLNFIPIGKKRRVNKVFSAKGIFCSATKYSLIETDLSKSINFYPPGRTLWTAWGDRDLGIFSIDEIEQQYIAELYESFLKFDVALWRSSSGPFGGGGLTVVIHSKVPDKYREQMFKHDEEQYFLEQKVKERLQKANKKYQSLSARIDNDNLKFWLNPVERGLFNYGWFTVEDLDLWIDGKGPVVK